MIAYRPDVDGLRALAVLLVVFYHFQISFFSGGYIGVDVFFVISGYLITSILLTEMEAGSFSFWRFYERRVRRILPALFLVLFATTIAAVIILFPPELEYYGLTLASVAGFGSNILFWDQSGYFEIESTLVPLLHTWSLAVEEQFYLLFPVFLFVGFKFLRPVLVPLVFLGLGISFAISIWGIENGKFSAVFYLLPPRVWELLVGAVLAFSFVRPLRHKILANGLGLIGLGMILYAGLMFSEDTAFPGWPALVPVLGAALVIYSALDCRTYVARVLGMAGPVFIGKISYSLYLWHWPFVAFYIYASPQDLDAFAVSLMFACCVVLSYLSWRFVEQPARQSRLLSRKQILALAAGISFLFLDVGLGLYWSKGLPERFPTEIQRLIHTEIGADLPGIKDLGFEENSGVLGDPQADLSFVVWGDSHAYAASPAIHALARKAGRKGYLIEDSACLPLFGSLVFMEDSCNDFNQRTLAFLKEHDEVQAVVMVAFWSRYERRFERFETQRSFAEHMDLVFKTLTDLDKDIYFVLNVPTVGVQRVPLYLARSKYYGQEVNLDTELNAYFEEQIHVKGVLEDLRQRYDFTVIYPHESLCDDEICRVVHDGRPLYRDQDHLSRYGALHHKDIFAPVFEGLDR